MRIPPLRTTFGAACMTIFIACAMIATLALSGCAHQTDEEAIESSIAKQLDGYKSSDSTETANFAVRMDVDSLSQYGVSMNDFMEAYFDGFDYEIQGVDVNGDEAVATVVLKCKSFSGYESALEEATENLKNDKALATMSTAELDEAFGDAIIESLKNVEVTTTKPVMIRFEKTDNVWVPVSDATDDIATALILN